MLLSTTLLLGLIGLGQAAPYQATFESPHPESQFKVKVGDIGPWPYPDDTPAQGFIDKSGKYYFQQSAALYEAKQSRAWSFFSGTTIDDAKVK